MCEPATITMAAIAIVGAVYGYQTQKNATEQMAKVQQDQIDQASFQKKNERMEEARALRASARAGAAEAGVSGNSVSVLLDDIMGQAGRDVSLIETNRKNGVMASQAEAGARIRGAQATAATQIASTGVGAYQDYSRYKINTT